MKSIFVLSALFISISLLILQSNSFTTAEIRSEATINLVSEENALIAINYGENKMFTVTNNTDKTIEIESIDIKGIEELFEVDEKDSFILSGESKEFTVSGDSKELAGEMMSIMVRWNEGIAEITSMLPMFKDDKEETKASGEKEGKTVEENKKIEEPAKEEKIEESEKLEEPEIVESEKEKLEVEKKEPTSTDD